MEDPVLPPWLDANFLAAALQGGEELVPQVKVTKFSAALAVAAGNNYLSRLYRVTVDYIEEEKEKFTSLIIKAPCTNAIMQGMVDEDEFNSKEPDIYKNVLPIINGMVNTEFGPTSYFHSENNTMVLSDLKQYGYEMSDRFKQLDYPHCKKVLTKLARFHAASVACNRDHPELIELVGKEVFYKDGKKFESSLKPWLQITFKVVAGIVKELDPSGVLEDMLLDRSNMIGDSMTKLCKPKTTGLNVLNHGDLWVNNILFKHTSSGDIEDVKFIDFQLVRYASPVLDILYFIWTSANEDVRESRLQELFEIYRSTLNSTLEELKCEERLTAEEFHEDVRDATDWVLAVVCSSLPFVVCEVEDVINMDEITPEEFEESEGQPDKKYFKKFNGKHYRALLPKIVEHFLIWVNHYK